MIRVDTKMFFTATPVKKAVDRTTRRVLSRFGAFVRTAARHSIRPRKRAARPGEPPSSHTGLLRRLIYFGYDPRKRGVVIGPAALNQRSPYGPTTIPELMEEGGTVSATRRGKRRRLRYAPHPYMGPAFEKEKPKLPDMWRNSVRK